MQGDKQVRILEVAPQPIARATKLSQQGRLELDLAKGGCRDELIENWFGTYSWGSATGSAQIQCREQQGGGRVWFQSREELEVFGFVTNAL